MRIVFMGTPELAKVCLEAVLRHPAAEVVGVFTQVDKPKGRGMKMIPSPVKELALERGIPVYQPTTFKNGACLDLLKELDPEVIIVAAYGKILPQYVLDFPKYGCMNVHASLLPKLRGAAPIQWSVIDGDKESGVTIMQMDKGLDTGDILLVEKYTLDPKETGGSLFDKLSGLGGPLLLQALEQAEQGTLSPVPQEHEKHTYAKMLSKALGEIDFTKDAIVIERLIRGLNPWPSAYTHLDGKMLKLWDADVKAQEQTPVAKPGQIVEVGKDYFTVQTGRDLLVIRSLQLEGKKRMDTEAFLRGYSLTEESILS